MATENSSTKAKRVRKEGRAWGKSYGTTISLGLAFCEDVLDPIVKRLREERGDPYLPRSAVARELIAFAAQYQQNPS